MLNNIGNPCQIIRNVSLQFFVSFKWGTCNLFRRLLVNYLSNGCEINICMMKLLDTNIPKIILKSRRYTFTIIYSVTIGIILKFIILFLKWQSEMRLYSNPILVNYKLTRIIQSVNITAETSLRRPFRDVKSWPWLSRSRVRRDWNANHFDW